MNGTTAGMSEGVGDGDDGGDVGGVGHGDDGGHLKPYKLSLVHPE